MFIGEFKHNLDEKGRLAVPVKFRGDLGTHAIVTRGLDGCLFLYTLDQWEKLASKLAALPFNQANPRAFNRLLLSGAMDVEMDGQGRILIPDYLREYAGLKKQAVIAGLYDRLEIWDEEKWIAYKQKAERSSDEIAEKLGELKP